MMGKSKHVLSFFFVAGLVVALQGCQRAKVERSADLVVMEQTDSVFGCDEENNDSRAFFDIDVPINGPQNLVDSLMALINREVYDCCESCAHYDNMVTYSPEEVFTDDASQLLSHYMEKYRPLLSDSLSGMVHFAMKMEVQTASYVTYGLEYYHCGGSCGSEKYYFTFDKRDGHQLKEIISHQNLVRFFEDYPEYAAHEGYLWQFSPESDYDNSCFGLPEDHFSFVINGWYNHYFSVDVPYSQIFSYLSPEAQALVQRNSEEEPMLPAYLPDRSEDDQAWMQVDTVNHVLLGYVSAAGGPLVSKLMDYEPELEIYPKRTHVIVAADGSAVYLFIYSRGHLLYCDEALTCLIEEDGLQPVSRFQVEDQKDSVISCMWYDQLVEASNGFPFDEVDENRFGIYYDRFTKRLYVPIMDDHAPDSEFADTKCLLYTGRFEVLQFNGMAFVPAGTDGAWWLNKDLRNYKQTISNRKNDDGIEQIDLMPDGTYRRAIWKGAKTLDDLRKKPDEVKISKNKDFKE